MRTHRTTRAVISRKQVLHCDPTTETHMIDAEKMIAVKEWEENKHLTLMGTKDNEFGGKLEAPRFKNLRVGLMMDHMGYCWTPEHPNYDLRGKAWEDFHAKKFAELSWYRNERGEAKPCSYMGEQTGLRMLAITMRPDQAYVLKEVGPDYEGVLCNDHGSRRCTGKEFTTLLAKKMNKNLAEHFERLTKLKVVAVWSHFGESIPHWEIHYTAVGDDKKLLWQHQGKRGLALLLPSIVGVQRLKEAGIIPTSKRADFILDDRIANCRNLTPGGKPIDYELSLSVDKEVGRLLSHFAPAQAHRAKEAYSDYFYVNATQEEELRRQLKKRTEELDRANEELRLLRGPVKAPVIVPVVEPKPEVLVVAKPVVHPVVKHAELAKPVAKVEHKVEPKKEWPDAYTANDQGIITANEEVDPFADFLESVEEMELPESPKVEEDDMADLFKDPEPVKPKPRPSVDMDM